MRKCFEVKTPRDNAKKYARAFDLKDDDWDYCFDTASFYINDNYKELERNLKRIFGKIKLVK